MKRLIPFFVLLAWCAPIVSAASPAGICVGNAIAGHPTAQINPEALREYDIRGTAEGPKAQLNEFEYYWFGRAKAEMLRRRLGRPGHGREKFRVGVGGDARNTTDAFREAYIQGLVDAGVDVVRLTGPKNSRKNGRTPKVEDVVSTPMTYFAGHQYKSGLDLDGTDMITASHNPKTDNGLKGTIGNEVVFGAGVQEMGRIAQGLINDERARGSARKHPAPGRVEGFDIVTPYWNFLEKHLDKYIKDRDPKLFAAMKTKKIVLDCTNGASGPISPGAFRRIFGEDWAKDHLVVMNDDPNGEFPNHNGAPDPSIAKNLETLQKRVNNEHADLGIAYDGDADRMVAVDEQGRILPGDETGLVFSRLVQRERPGAPIKGEVNTDQWIYSAVAEAGGQPIIGPTGSAPGKGTMKPVDIAATKSKKPGEPWKKGDGIPLLFETSGHYVFGEGFRENDRADDAILNSFYFLEELAHSGQPLSSLVKRPAGLVSTPGLRVTLTGESKKFPLVNEFKARIKQIFPNQVNEVDGARVNFPDGKTWFIVRASNTEPKLGIKVVATSQTELDRLKRVIADTLKAAAEQVGYPDPIRF